MTASVLQERGTDTAGGSITTLALAFSSNVTAGSSGHAAGTVANNSVTAVSFSDSKNGAWTTLNGSVSDTTNNQMNGHAIVNSMAAGATTVTLADGSVTSDFFGIIIREIGGTSGYDTGKHAERFQNNPGTGANAISASAAGVSPASQPGLLSVVSWNSSLVGDTALVDGSDVSYTSGLNSATCGWANVGSAITESFRYTATTALKGSATDATNGGTGAFSTFAAFFVESGGGGSTFPVPDGRPPPLRDQSNTLLRM